MEHELRPHGPLDIYYIFWSEGRRSRRRSTRTADRKEAEKFYAGFILELEEPTHNAKPAELSIDSILEAYWNESAKKNDSPKTAKIHIAHLRAFHGNDTVADLTAERHDAYEAHCRQNDESDAYINRRRSVLRAALRHAMKRHRLAAAPLIPTLEEPDPRSDVLSRGQIARLIKAARSKPELRYLSYFIALFLVTGHRKTAILELTWGRVDLSEGTVEFRVPGKKYKKKKRTKAALPAKTIRLLRNWRKRSPGPYVVSAHGRFCHTFKRQWRRVETLAGMPGIGTHILKHTAATWALRVVPDWIVEGQMATSARTLRRVYGKHLTSDLRAMTEAVAHARPGLSAQRVRNEPKKKVIKKPARAKKKTGRR